MRLGTLAKSTTVEGYLDGYCSTLPNRMRVCKVQLSDDGESKFIIQKNGEILNEIPAPFWSTFDAPPDGFVTYHGDIDGNGAAEVIVVSYDGVSNGMGVTYTTANIFKDPVAHRMVKPVSVPIQEFGPRENFRYNSAKNRTEILVTYWEDYESLDPKRIPGVYLVGKWFLYKDGVLEPEFSRPTLARRLLNSFARERDNGWYENRTPFKWLQNRTTHRFFREPAEIHRRISTSHGVLAGYTFKSGEIVMAVRKADVVQKVAVAYGYVTSPEENTLYVSSLGLLSKRYLYPKSYDLTNSLGSVIGKSVRIDTYKDENDNEFSKLWILN